MMAGLSKLNGNQVLQLAQNKLGPTGCLVLSRSLSDKMYKYWISMTQTEPSEPGRQQRMRYGVHYLTQGLRAQPTSTSTQSIPQQYLRCLRTCSQTIHAVEPRSIGNLLALELTHRSWCNPPLRRRLRQRRASTH